MIRNVSLKDVTQIAGIYNYYVNNSIVTFDVKPNSYQDIKDKIIKTLEKFPWIVYEVDGEILGYAHASEWKSKDGYKHSTETTIYLKHDSVKKGIGSLLYSDLINRLKELKYHALMGCITLPNDTSITMHEKFGFQKVGQFKEVGFKFGKWIDVGYWELII